MVIIFYNRQAVDIFNGKFLQNRIQILRRRRQYNVKRGNIIHHHKLADAPGKKYTSDIRTGKYSRQPVVLIHNREIVLFCL